MDIIYRDYSN